MNANKDLDNLFQDIKETLREFIFLRLDKKTFPSVDVKKLMQDKQRVEEAVNFLPQIRLTYNNKEECFL